MCFTPLSLSDPATAWAQPRDLVVISGALVNHRRLVQSVVTGVPVLRLSCPLDGLATITQTLAALSPVKCLHLVTPISCSGLPLGQVTLTAGNLASHAGAIAAWRNYLTTHSAIVIYNGQMARSEAGQQLIDVLHHLTGAAIAACTTLPNPTLPQGHWEFDCVSRPFWPNLAMPPLVLAEGLQAQPRRLRRLPKPGVRLIPGQRAWPSQPAVAMTPQALDNRATSCPANLAWVSASN